MSHTSFRMNLHSIVCLNVKELLDGSRRHIWSLSDRNGIRTHNHLVRKRTLKHLVKLASLAKWSSVRLRTKWLWVGIPLLSLASFSHRSSSGLTEMAVLWSTCYCDRFHDFADTNAKCFEDVFADSFFSAQLETENPFLWLARRQGGSCQFLNVLGRQANSWLLEFRWGCFRFSRSCEGQFRNKRTIYPKTNIFPNLC